MALGIGTFLGGIGKILDKLPIQGRKERWKNEVDNLKAERASIMTGKATLRLAQRVQVIDLRLEYLAQLLKNSAND